MEWGENTNQTLTLRNHFGIDPCVARLRARISCGFKLDSSDLNHPSRKRTIVDDARIGVWHHRGYSDSNCRFTELRRQWINALSELRNDLLWLAEPCNSLEHHHRDQWKLWTRSHYSRGSDFGLARL